MSTYPKLYTLGHRALANVFFESVEVEEKVDGSQFTFGNFDGALKCFSKNCLLYEDSVPALFQPSYATAKRLYDEGLLQPGVVYRGEAMCAPKHNTLCYGRAPKGNIVLFDVMVGTEHYLEHADKVIIADTFGIDVTPLIYKGPVNGQAQLEAMLDRVSFLGGQKIEGVVFKNYTRFGLDGKPLFGKLVSDAFKEVHNKEWKKTAPNKKDIIEMLVDRYKTPARYDKAVQHLRDDGRLTESPKDIGPLMGECLKDILAECGDEIKDAVFDWAWKQIGRGIANGIPQWYKEKLAKAQTYTETLESVS